MNANDNDSAPRYRGSVLQIFVIVTLFATTFMFVANRNTNEGADIRFVRTGNEFNTDQLDRNVTGFMATLSQTLKSLETMRKNVQQSVEEAKAAARAAVLSKPPEQPAPALVVANAASPIASLNTGLSERESYDFFHYSDELWKVKKQIYRKQQLNQRIQESQSRGGPFYQYNWEPDFTCDYEERVGAAGDGGKWLCDAYKIAALDECYIMSVGSANDYSFETTMHALNPKCEIHTFDHTIVPQNVPSFVKFHSFGIGAVDAGNTLTMTSLLKASGLEGKKIDVLKIDCEGCEGQVYPQFFQAFIRQVLIELHFGWNGFGDQQNHNFFEEMRAHGYAIFHKEPNIAYTDGSCIEYTFIKLNLPK